jgi:hypothetical protein
MRWLSLLCMAVVMNQGAIAEELVNVTTFKLANGEDIQAFRYLAIGEGSEKQYEITSIEGELKTVREADVVSRQSAQIADSFLAASLRPKQKKAAIVNAAEVSGSRARFGEALHKVRGAGDVSRKAINDLNDARHALLLASRELDEVDAAIGAQEAKIEGLLSQVFVRVGTDTRRLDLERARAEELRLKQARRPVDEKVAALKAQVADLEEKANYAKVALDAAQRSVDATRGELIREQKTCHPRRLPPPAGNRPPMTNPHCRA